MSKNMVKLWHVAFRMVPVLSIQAFNLDFGPLQWFTRLWWSGSTATLYGGNLISISTVSRTRTIINIHGVQIRVTLGRACIWNDTCTILNWKLLVRPLVDISWNWK